MKSRSDKFRLYKGLYVLNRGFALIAQNSTSRAIRLIAEELRAQVNYSLTELLRDREQDDWARFGRLRFPITPDERSQLKKLKNKNLTKGGKNNG